MALTWGGIAPVQPQQPWPPDWPQAGQSAQRIPGYRANIHTPTPGFFAQQGGGDTPFAPPMPVTPAPQISQGPIWSPTDIQNELNLQQADANAKLQTQFGDIDKQQAGRGLGDTAATTDMKNRLWALMQGQLASNETQLRFNTAQANAAHRLSTEQAGSNQYFQQLQDELARRNMGFQGWGMTQQYGQAESEMAARLAEAEAGRSQESAMKNLGFGQDVQLQELLNNAGLGKLALQQAHEKAMQVAQFGENAAQRGWQTGEAGAQRGWQTGEAEAQRGWQGGQNAEERNLAQLLQAGKISNDQFMQARDIMNREFMQGRQISSTEALAAASNELDWAKANAQIKRDVTLTGMQGANQLAAENLRGQYALTSDQLRNQQAQWGQTFGTAADMEKQRQDFLQQEFMANLGDINNQNAWLQQQQVGFGRDVGNTQWQDWAAQRAAVQGSAQQNWRSAQEFERQWPLAAAAQNAANYRAETERYPYQPWYMNERAFQNTWQQTIPVIAKALMANTPQAQSNMLGNLTNLLAAMFRLQGPGGQVAGWPPGGNLANIGGGNSGWIFPPVS